LAGAYAAVRVQKRRDVPFACKEPGADERQIVVALLRRAGEEEVIAEPVYVRGCLRAAFLSGSTQPLRQIWVASRPVERALKHPCATALPAEAHGERRCLSRCEVPQLNALADVERRDPRVLNEV